MSDAQIAAGEIMPGDVLLVNGETVSVAWVIRGATVLIFICGDHGQERIEASRKRRFGYVELAPRSDITADMPVTERIIGLAP